MTLRPSKRKGTRDDRRDPHRHAIVVGAEACAPRHLPVSFHLVPIKAVTRKAKCREINRFQSFIQSFPSFGRESRTNPTGTQSTRKARESELLQPPPTRTAA